MRLTTELPKIPQSTLALRFGREFVIDRCSKLARSFGIGKPLTSVDRSQLQIPKSRLTTKVTQLMRAVYSPALFAHCVRSFYFADVLGRRDGLKYDRELLFYGAALHDLGLSEKYNDANDFELTGARVAHEFLAENGLPPAKAEFVHEMIALHTSIGVASKREPEIALVHLGSGVDVFGVRIEDINQDTVRRIFEEQPRQGFKSEVISLVRDDARRKPDSFLARFVSVGFVQGIEFAPFAE